MSQKIRRYTFELRLEVADDGTNKSIKTAIGKFHIKRSTGEPVVKLEVPGTLKIGAEGLVFEQSGIPTPPLGADVYIQDEARTPSEDITSRLRRSIRIPKSKGFNFPIRHGPIPPES